MKEKWKIKIGYDMKIILQFNLILFKQDSHFTKVEHITLEIIVRTINIHLCERRGRHKSNKSFKKLTGSWQLDKNQ